VLSGIPRRLARQSGAYAAVAIAGSALGVLLLPVYTRVLSPAEFGLIALLDVLALLLTTVFSLGATAMVPFYYADEADPGRRRGCLGTLLIGITGINVLLTLVVITTAGVVVGALLPSVPVWPFVPVVAATALLEPYWIVAAAVLQIQERASTHSVLTFLRQVTANALRIVAVIVLDLGVLGFVGAGLVTALVWLLPAAMLLRRETTWSFAPRELWRALRVGGPTVPNNLLSYGFRAADRVVLERFATRDEIGLYYLALRIAEVGRLASDVFVSAWRPIFFKEAGRPGFAESVVPIVIRTSAVAFIGLFVAGALFAPEIVGLLMAAEYAGAALFVPPLLAAMALKGMYAPPYLMIWFRKKTGYLPLVSAATLVVGLTATLVLASRWGAWGAAIAYALSWTVLFAITLGLGRRLYRAPYPWREVVTASALAAAVVGVSTFVEPGLGGAAAKLALLAGFGVAIVATGCVRIAELRSALAPVRAVSRRRETTVTAR
jgi:O-antigen/teichoic acid export membrane protein